MKRSIYKSRINIGFWMFFSIALACLFLGYVGFSLHEQRSFQKQKLKLSSKNNHIYKTLSEDINQRDEFVSNISMINTDEDFDKYVKGYKLHAFNLLVSDRIGYEARRLPDTRPKQCQAQAYDLQAIQSQISVIICFYNEALSTLLRTISTVFERTSPILLKEIIVVDDGSTENFDSEIEKYVESKFFKTKLHMLRSASQMGLIRARMFGARHATGETLIFLDSHCEVNEGWVEPLLQQLVNQTSKIVSPVVDTIDADTFEYRASSVVRGGFNWGLHFSWEGLPASVDPNKAYPTPTISGGLFAVNRDGFFKLGGYDEEMDEWGGENLEISFRTWMCGGSLVIEPCSRVGHVFRRRRPYGGSNKSEVRNAVRLARVWLDDYQVHFNNIRKESQMIKGGDLSERIALRKTLKCKTFKWYLSTVYPEIGIPGERPSTIRYNSHRSVAKVLGGGPISVTGLPICLLADTNNNGISAAKCKDDGNTIWSYNSKDELMVDGTKLCLEGSATAVRLSKCEGASEIQRWKFMTTDLKHHNKMIGKLYDVAIGMCLAVNQIADNIEVVMRICNKPNVQAFAFDYNRQ